MKNYDFGIRVDMGWEIGSGHFFRCMAIAKELKKRKKDVIFLLNENKILTDYTKEIFPFFNLIGNYEERRIKHCKELLENIKVLIIDLPQYNYLYSKELGSEKNVVIIDDLGNIDIHSRILINGSIVKKFHNYHIRNKLTKTFFGSKFMILRKDFLNLRDKVMINDMPIRKILLTFGGNDDNNLTCKILPILINKKFEIIVILGPTNKNEGEIRRLIMNNSKIEIKTNVEDIAELFSKQDLVISASGVTTYELATLGIPTIMIPIDAAQYETAKTMESEGFGINYGFWDGDVRRFEMLLEKINDFNLRKQMYEKGRNIVDGYAVERVSKELLKLF